MATKKTDTDNPKRRRGIRRRRPGWDKKQKEIQEQVKVVEEKKQQKQEAIKETPVQVPTPPPILTANPIKVEPTPEPKPIVVDTRNSINNPYTIRFERDIEAILGRIFGSYFTKSERDVRKGNVFLKVVVIEDSNGQTHTIWFDTTQTSVLGRL